MRRAPGPVLRAAAAAGLALALTGCASDDPGRSAGPEPSTTGATTSAEGGAEGAAEQDPGDGTYVALGDSYTAAPMVGPTTELADGCFRSTENYPALVAEELSLDLVDVSCSGATTGDLLRPQVTLAEATLPPQVDALSTDTDLVTISLGGNDSGLFGNLVSGCGSMVASPAPTACTEADIAGGEGGVQRTAEQIRRRLVDGIRVVRERAPDARIVVVGYPQVAPARGACAALPVVPGDAGFARKVNRLLVEQMESAAAATGADYLDVFAATAGHDLCSDDPWIADGSASPPEAAPYHPLEAEQQAVAELLVELIEG